MPELPEVETTRRGITPQTQHQTITQIVIRNASLRWPVDENLPQKLPGLVIFDIQRRGKYLILKTAKGHLLIHLGMSGSLRVVPPESTVKKHDHIDLVMSNGLCLRYHDPRRFGAWLWWEGELNKHPLLEHLGPEPLSDEFNAPYLFAKSRKRQVAIKNFIMTSQTVVGAGNIYANESLFLSGIHPQMLASQLTLKQSERLVDNIKFVLARSIEQGGTTLRDFLSPDGTPGYFVQQLHVYGKTGEPCSTCGTAIEKVIINQRASFYCPNCQPKVPT